MLHQVGLPLNLFIDSEEEKDRKETGLDLPGLIGRVKSLGLGRNPHSRLEKKFKEAGGGKGIFG
jgi:hypothetical protein